MCGPLYENAIMSLITSITLILEIVHLMNMQNEEIYNIKNDDSFDKAILTITVIILIKYFCIVSPRMKR